MKTLLPFIQLLWFQRRWVVLGIGLGILMTMASISLLALSGWFIAMTAYVALSFSAAASFNYFLPAVGVRFFSLLRIMSQYGERVFAHETTFKILTTIRVWLYEKLEPLAPAHLLQFRIGDLLTRFSDDVEALDNLYLRILSPVVVLVVVSIMSFFMITFLINQTLAYRVIGLLLATGFIVPLFTHLIAHEKARRLTQQQAHFKTRIIDYLHGLTELSLFSQLKPFQQRLLELDRQFISSQRQMSWIAGLGAALITLFSGITIILALWWIIPLTIEGKINGGLIALLILGIMAAFEAVIPLPLAFQYLGRTLASARRLLFLIQQQPIVSYLHTTPYHLTNYTIDFKHVGFAYPGRKPLFNDFNLTIKQNDQVAIVGKTGVGKSSLIYLLARFWDVNSGSICINDIDIRNFSEQQLRQTVAIVEQNSHIFNATIRDNLLLANSTVEEWQMWQALQQVELASFVQQLPEGLDTWVGQQGQCLSGGQRKRLAIARAILQSAPIMILDEPTAGVDNITTEIMMLAIQQGMVNKTLIIITHDPLLIQKMPRIIHL